MTTCSFNLIAELAAELMLEDAKPLQLYMKANETKIIRFFVPEDAEINHISISTRAWNSFSKFQQLTQKGNEMPGTDRLPHSFPAWDNGYIA